MRTAAPTRCTPRLAQDRIYARNGLQFLTFNTMFQLAADELEGLLDVADTALLVPDLIGYWLTGPDGNRADQRLDHRAARHRRPVGRRTRVGCSACPTVCSPHSPNRAPNSAPCCPTSPTGSG